MRVVQSSHMSNWVPAILIATVAVFVLMSEGRRESALAGAASQTPATRPVIPTLPASRGGQDLIGKRMPPLQFERWINTAGNQPPDLSHSVVLYRWWTDTCPYCARTLPAIERLRQKYGPKGLKVVAVYHPKPPRDVAEEKILAVARQIGYDGAIAVDSRWTQLRNVWLSTGKRDATSLSFLVDRDGVIRFVHPGVEFFASDDPVEAQANADYQMLERAIRALLR